MNNNIIHFIEGLINNRVMTLQLFFTVSLEQAFGMLGILAVKRSFRSFVFNFRVCTR